MNCQQPLPLMDPEALENAIIVASLTHNYAKTPKAAAQAWDRLLELKAQRDQQRRGAA